MAPGVLIYVILPVGVKGSKDGIDPCISSYRNSNTMYSLNLRAQVPHYGAHPTNEYIYIYTYMHTYIHAYIYIYMYRLYNMCSTQSPPHNEKDVMSEISMNIPITIGVWAQAALEA